MCQGRSLRWRLALVALLRHVYGNQSKGNTIARVKRFMLVVYTKTSPLIIIS